jgi:hypothetical protein
MGPMPIVIISPKIEYTLGFVQRHEPVLVQTLGLNLPRNNSISVLSGGLLGLLKSSLTPFQHAHCVRHQRRTGIDAELILKRLHELARHPNKPEPAQESRYHSQGITLRCD